MTDPDIPPVADRSDPPFTGGERLQLEAWLDYHRATLLYKCAGLTDEQLKTRSVPPSSLSLLGLVRHLADVERSWFRRQFAGEDAPSIFYSDQHPDGDFDLVDHAQVDHDFAVYRAEVQSCRLIAAAQPDLDAIGRNRRHGRDDVSLRWIYLHLIEEYARHNGHADLLRQCIDGATGD